MSSGFEEITWPSGTLWPPNSDASGEGEVATANLADFGGMIASADVDDAVISTLKAWVPTYLKHIGLSKGLDYDLGIPAESSYSSVLSQEQYADRRLPGILVATAKTQGTPVVTDEGSYLTTWLVAVSALVRGRNAQETRQNASYFELACRASIVHHQDLGGFALGTKWVGGGEARPLVDPNGKGRWLAEGASQYWVMTQTAIQEGIGPTVPDQEPYGPLAQVESVDIELDGLGPATET